MVEGVEPIEKRLVLYAVEFYQVAHQVLIDYGSLNAAEKVFLKHFLSLLGMAHIAHILLVHGVKIAALYPAALKTGFLEQWLHRLVGVNYQALGIRNVVAHQDACHALTGAVFDAEARIDYQAAFVLILLQFGYRGLLATHVHYHALLNAVFVKLVLVIDVHYASALTQVFRHGIKYCRVVAYMVWRICAGAHYACYYNVCHSFLLYNFVVSFSIMVFCSNCLLIMARL